MSEYEPPLPPVRSLLPALALRGRVRIITVRRDALYRRLLAIVSLARGALYPAKVNISRGERAEGLRRGMAGTGTVGLSVQRERAKVSVDTSVICLIKAASLVIFQPPAACSLNIRLHIRNN